jgi:hypothetical protein
LWLLTPSALFLFSSLLLRVLYRNYIVASPYVRSS